MLLYVLVPVVSSLCFAVNNTFTFTFDPFASSTGYYRVEECGDEVQPTLAMEMHTEYRFLQHNITNWMHPLGFAYEPDGAHVGVDELEPEISGSNSSCVLDASCQTPLYFKDGVDVGLDGYEPDFFLQRATWAESIYDVKLTLTEAVDVFYFCHIHPDMSGRIKVVNGTTPLNADSPLYQFEMPSAFDEMCGTFELENFQESSGTCSDTFFCGDTPSGLDTFADCLYAVDCHMDSNMRTVWASSDPLVAFMHQMIPHHENAVNMAKLMLKSLPADYDNDDIIDTLWDIINTQNYQIGIFEGWLDENQYARSATCDLCQDSTSWYKNFEPSKTCEWVAAFVPTRCAVKGSDRTLAADACPLACGQCAPNTL